MSQQQFVDFCHKVMAPSIPEGAKVKTKGSVTVVTVKDSPNCPKK